MSKVYKIILCFIYLILGLFFVIRSVKAGKLDDFEKDFILKPKEKEDREKEKKRTSTSENSCFGDIFESCLGGLLSTLIFKGGSASQERVSTPAEDRLRYPEPGSNSREESKIDASKDDQSAEKQKPYQVAEKPSQVDETPVMGLKPRKPGEPLIPFIRLDISYRDVESDVYACDWLMQVGYGPFGFQFLQTRYWEDDPSDKLKINQIHGLGRLSFGDKVEIDLGLGASMLHGNIGLSATSPILIYPWEIYPWKIVGFEFRPSWASINETSINDYDLGLALRWQSISLLMGYRWLKTTNESLDGTHIGLSFRI